MSKPHVSIGLPVFNGANYLRCSISSLLAQDYDDFELIISDNGSTDATEAICREFAAADNRISYHRNSVNIGAAANYNRVFHLAQGELFKWAAHDDECYPRMIGRCVELLDSSPGSVTMVYPRGELIDGQGRTIQGPLDRIETRDPRPYRRLGRVIRALSACDPIFGLYKTSFLKRTRLIGSFFGADYVLLGELAMLGEIWEVDEVLFRLRAHPKRSMTANTTVRARIAWYNPAAAKKPLVLPDWEQMVWELSKSALRAPLPAAERLRCWAMVPGAFYGGRIRDTGGRWKRRLKSRIGSSHAASAIRQSP